MDNSSIHSSIKEAPKIGVFGSDGEHCTKEARETAYVVGKLLAKNGAVVFTGGGHGVMEAAAKGAQEQGGLVVSILHRDCTDNCHQYASLNIPTGIGFARSQILTNSVDGAILIEGGIGTHQEACMMYWLKKPTVAITSSGGIAASIAGTHLDKRKLVSILSASSPEEAVNLVLEKVKSLRVLQTVSE